MMAEIAPFVSGLDMRTAAAPTSGAFRWRRWGPLGGVGRDL